MAGVNDLIQRLERFATAEVKQRIASKVRDAVHSECVRGFNEKRDPYGTSWAPRKDSRGNWPLLDKTGAGINSLTATASADAVRLRIVSYMKFHQSGTSKMRPRMIFPDPNRGLGLWSEPVHQAAVAAVQELMK
jgi:hypothetical protein